MPTTLSSFESTLAFYRDNAKHFVDSTVCLDLRNLYRPFLSRLNPGAHILDAGCGSGRDGAAFVARGYQVTAVDASSAMVSAARERGLKAQVLRFQRMTWCAEFDGIWACASLLHVPHRQIPGVLERFAHALKPGGILYISLKEGEGEGIAKDGRFFSYFRQREFERVLQDSGNFALLDSWLTYSENSADKEWPWLNYLARRLAS